MSNEIILSIDVSREPAQLLLALVDGDRLRSLKDLSIDTEGLFDYKKWEQKAQGETLEPVPEGSATEPIKPPVPVVKLEEVFKERCAQLRTVLRSLPAEWNSSALIFGARESLALTVNLPFSDQKQIARVLKLEVQDHVPFDLSNFIICHGTPRAAASGGFDVPTALVPREVIKHIMKVCGELEIDPMVVSTPVGILPNLFAIAPELKRPTCAVILASGHHLCLTILEDGQVVSERSAPLKDADSDPYNSIVELRHAIVAAEQQLGKKIERTYLLGDGIDNAQIQGVLQREVVSISASELIVDAPAQTISAALAIPSANEIAPVASRVNFRQGEFAYGIPTKEIWRAAVALAPYFAVVCILLIFGLAISYLGTSYKIAVRKMALREQITSVIPDIVFLSGREDVTVDSYNLKIENDLKNLGSFSRISPLDALAEISNDLPMSSGIVGINRIFIRDSKATIEGRLGSYSARDKLEKAFKKRRTMYCKVDEIDTTAPNAGTGGSIGFVMNTSLCE